MFNDKNDKSIRHVKCEAEHCVFNDHELHCCATEIMVGNPEAHASGETKCETFKCS